MTFKKILFLFCWLLPLFCGSQTLIQIEFHDIQADTISIAGMSDEHKMENIYAAAYASTITYSPKSPLTPGVYWILADGNLADAFIISDTNHQQFTIQVQPEQSLYLGSQENTRYHEYIRHLSTFNDRMQQLNLEFQQAKQHMPSYMLQVVVDTLNVKSRAIHQEKLAYQKQVIRENTGTLLASIVAATTDIPQPSADIQSNQWKMQEHYCQHFFDNFPWEDARIYRTSIAVKKIDEFCRFLFQYNRPDFNAQVLAYLDSAKVSQESYLAYFKLLEKNLGNHASPLRMEPLYIDMLQDMCSTPNLPELYQRHCQYELSRVNINNVGDIVPNFNLVMSDGTKSSLYDIQSEYLLLYLQHPTCPTCERIRRMMADSPVLDQAIASGRLKVLTVYFEDDPDTWENYIHSANANPAYLHGWNQDLSIELNNLYDTRAIPYIFILDQEKRVVVKNLNEHMLDDEIKKIIH